jgi:adenylylsulfate kinase
MGLPGSGKTTLASELAILLFPHVEWFNADEVRSMYNDWDFSVEGRLRQSYRMRELADKSTQQYVICDFVAPIDEMRAVFDPDYLIWMDTIDRGRYEDTNSLFNPPKYYDLRITELDSKKWSEIIKYTLTK